MLINGSWTDSYNKSERLLTLKNGSTVQFMSYEQETEKFAGTSLHFVHFDEEPPMHIFNECGARLVDTNGRWWCSMTPVEGLTWTYEKLYKPGAELNDPLIGVIEADMLDNPHLSAEAAEAYLSGLDDEERKAREHGSYVQLGGLVYKQFTEPLHTIDPIIPPKEWLWYCSLDHGYNNPTAVLWHAVSPEGYTVTFGEHYKREWTLDQHAEAILKRNAEYGKVPDYYVGDPAIAQRSAHFGTSIQTEYAMRGIPIALGNNNVEIGVAKVQNYLRMNPETKKPNYQITKNCTAYIDEMKKLRWKTYSSKKMTFANNAQEQIHKKDDHACDSARYFFSFLPDLAPYQMVTEPDIPEPPANKKGGGPVYGSIDDVLAAMSKGGNKTQWHKEVVGTDLQGLEYD
jgi:phage terminase large subunit-like protein